MPIYEFQCKKCNDIFREFATIEDKKAGKITCPNCGSKDLDEEFSTNCGGVGDSCGGCSGGSCGSCG